jgi:uncharacterized membrane protein required for colicin V production
MLFNFLDIIFLGIMAWFAWRGYKKGLIESLSSFLGLTFGLYFSAKLYVPVGNWVSWLTGWGTSFCRILVFVLLFVLIDWFINYLCYLANRFLELLYKIPFVHKLGDLLGALCALLESVVIVSILIYVIGLMPGKNILKEPAQNSTVAKYITKTENYVWPFLPKLFKNLV